MTTLVTGGLGFIGSHLIDSLMTQRTKICVFDNLSAGTLENLKKWQRNPNLKIVKGDLLSPRDLAKLDSSDFDVVYHLAANPEVRVGLTNPKIHFEQNILATHNLLEHIRKTKGNPTLVFTSTSTVYGEATKIPTPEDYGPLMPISTYGASKLACEALIAAYAHNHNYKTVIIRLANIVGPRSQHGVLHDFIHKLQENNKELEILGDGTQNKSYLHITDCIEAILHTMAKKRKQVEIYNVGSEDQINVKNIAQIVTQEMKLKNVKLKITGGVDGGKGWKGDVKDMLLDTTKIKKTNWKPKHNSRQSIRKAARQLIAQKKAEGKGSQ
jgi:UDP-glucose 4-epimerase